MEKHTKGTQRQQLLHIIGLPQKDGVDKPLYDYERVIFDSLVTRDGDTHLYGKHLWIKKATGLGISEFILRFMAWLCLKDYALSGSQMCIVTEPRIDLAIALIDRMKKLFAGKHLNTFDTKETEAVHLLWFTKPIGDISFNGFCSSRWMKQL
jgi:hypothetical protein